MNDFEKSCYQSLPPVCKPEIPKIRRADIFSLIAIFASVFVYSLYSAPLSVEYLFEAKLGGYVKFLCLSVVFIHALFYVKKEKGASNSSVLFFALCSLCFIFPFLLNGGRFYFLICFLYLVGAMCVTKTGSLRQKRNSYRYLYEELRDIFIYPFRYCLLPIKGILKQLHFRKNKKLNGVLLGCILAIPVVAVLFVLLYSGDAAFSNITSKLTGLISRIIDKLVFSADFEFFLVLIQAVFYTLFFGTAVYSALFLFRHGIQKKIKQNSAEVSKPLGSFIPENVASGFYIAVCLLYVFYLFSQLSYFFGAFSGKIPLAVNMSLSEYARQGFFEMSAIAFINLMLIALGIMFVKRREKGRIAPLFMGVFTFLCLFTELLIITAMSKMALYITELGLTHKRILVCIIDVLLFSIVLCVLIKLYKASFPYMKIIVSLCCAVISLYAFIGDGVLIANFNTNAYLKGYHKEFDLHTVRLESDRYNYLKSMHKIASSDKEASYDAKYHIGEALYNCSYYEYDTLERNLKASTMKSFFYSDSLTDFLFWEYAKDNKKLMKKCIDIYDKKEKDKYDDYYDDYAEDEYSYIEEGEKY